MPIFTIYKDFIQNAIPQKRIGSILGAFWSENTPFKVALDTSNVVYEIYAKIAEENYEIASWIRYMNCYPTSFEEIQVNLTNETHIEGIFLKLCSSIKVQKKIIVFSHECWENHTYCSKNMISYEGNLIQVYDRDEAYLELYKTETVSVYGNDNNLVLNSNKTDIKNDGN